MANVLREQKLVDTQKRALIKYVFVGDGTAVANSTLIDVSALAYALNANGQILGAGTDPKSNHRTKIKRVFGTAKVGGLVKLQWKGDSNGEIVTLNTGDFDYNFDAMGDGAVIGNPEANTNGDILYSIETQGSNCNFTLFVDLRKDNNDFDAGQSADSGAFNPSRIPG
jgi:hypothetical protein